MKKKQSGKTKRRTQVKDLSPGKRELSKADERSVKGGSQPTSSNEVNYSNVDLVKAEVIAKFPSQTSTEKK
jgi:hypothetical protein